MPGKLILGGAGFAVPLVLWQPCLSAAGSRVSVWGAHNLYHSPWSVGSMKPATSWVRVAKSLPTMVLPQECHPNWKFLGLTDSSQELKEEVQFPLPGSRPGFQHR